VSPFRGSSGASATVEKRTRAPIRTGIASRSPWSAVNVNDRRHHGTCHIAAVASTVEIAMPDGVADAYLARSDDGTTGHPGVLLIMDAYGLRPAVAEMVDRIAADGFSVLAPNVFYRAGPSPVGPEMDFSRIRPLIAELTPGRLGADGAAYLDYLAEVASPGPVGITGYCMGGRVGWWIAVAHPGRVAALAGFHTAGLVTEAPDSPHRRAGDVNAELYFGFADDDPGMTDEQIATFERALDDAGVRYRAEVYEGARHGYAMADLAVYDEGAAERHFRELRALLERTLG
jgi:carboxymethylenebutenolidase